MLSSSVQATLAGRFGNSEYGRSKKAGEELFTTRNGRYCIQVKNETNIK